MGSYVTTARVSGGSPSVRLARSARPVRQCQGRRDPVGAENDVTAVDLVFPVGRGIINSGIRPRRHSRFGHRRFLCQELGEVQTAHVAKVERTTRQPLRRARGKPVAEIRYLLRRNRRPDCHAKLVWHGSVPVSGRNTIIARSPGSTAGTRSERRAGPGGVAGNGAARCQSWTSSPATPCRSAYRPAA